MLRRIADAEQIEADDRTLATIARSAGGSFRDAIGTLDQLVTYGGKQVAFEDVLEVLDVADADLIFRTTDALIAHDPGAALDAGRGADRDRAAIRPSSCATSSPTCASSSSSRRSARRPTRSASPPTRPSGSKRRRGQISQLEAVRAIDLVSAALEPSRTDRTPASSSSSRCLKAARPRADASIEALLARIEQLERRAGPGPDAGGPSGGRARPCERATGARAAEKRVTGRQTEAEQAAPSGRERATGPEQPLGRRRRRSTRSGPRRSSRCARSRAARCWRRCSPGRGRSRSTTSRLVLSYPASAAFSKRKVESPANRERIAEALRLVTGQALALEFELSDEPAEESGGTAPEDFLERGGADCEHSRRCSTPRTCSRRRS